MKTWLTSLIMAATLCGCATTRSSDVAAAAGYPRDSRVEKAGPYSIHYGSNGSNDLLVVTRGEESVCSKIGNTLTVYARGRSLFNYAEGSGGKIIAAYMIHIRDEQGAIAFTLMDENADGEFDRKIDYGTQEVYEWKDGKWTGKKKIL
jgi:hypothetical protein